ncbi:MAG: serine hydrolase domain-containing protein [Opitutaceae bacterium]|nr:serine hydrolase domain-containing protein [Opitutaceae bacterium]
MKPAAFFLLLTLIVRAVAAEPASTNAYVTPRFSDPDRRARLDALLPEIDREFRDHAAKKNYPGLVWGIVLDGALVHTGAQGFAHVDKNIPAAADTRFRIASMTKSFTALAILQLRDTGQLSLEDHVVRHVPELARTAPLTADAPPITIRHLLAMSPGFPEDNPWGDRQLAVTVAEFEAFLREGLALSNVPGVAFEYSNLAYALLGQIITHVSGQPYQRFITEKILRPLGLKDTVWEFSAVPAAQLALGYRGATGAWQLEPLLPDGTYGAMGGLLTTMNDFARYAALHLGAWPPRNDPESPVARRATLREMHLPAMFSGLAAQAKALDGSPQPIVNAYAFGLGWSFDSRGVVRVGHSGGLPGFGSNWRFYPDHGFAVISFANLTYAGTGAVNAKVADLLIEKARLPRRTLPPAPILRTRATQVAQLVQSWDKALAEKIVAENFFPDRALESWRTHATATLAQAGAIKSVGDIVPENQLRGTFPLHGERGRVDVFFTLTPERDPRVQELRLTFVPKP